MNKHKGHTKYWKPYVRYSIDKFAIPLLEDFERKVMLWESLDQSSAAVQELINEGLRSIQQIKDEIKNGYFVADDMCDEEGVMINYGEYYPIRIAELEGDIEDVEKLKKSPFCTEKHFEQLDSKVKDIKRHIRNCKNKLAEFNYGGKEEDFAALIRRNRNGER